MTEEDLEIQHIGGGKREHDVNLWTETAAELFDNRFETDITLYNHTTGSRGTND